MAIPLWLLGVVLIIVGSLGNNYGNNLVSLGHKIKKASTQSQKMNSLEDKVEANVVEKPEQEETEAEKRSHERWRTFGIFVIVVANLATFAAFGFAAQSLLAALESVQFLSNVAFAKIVHHENVTRRTIFATLMIVVGNVLVVIFADRKAEILNSADIIELYRTNTVYHGYLVIAFILFVSMHFTYAHYHKARVEHGRTLWKHSFMEPFAYSVSAAIIGTQAVLNSKCMSMLIQSSARTSRNEFVRAPIYVILVTWIMFVAYWLRRLDKGLELFPPQFIIPVLQVFFVFFAILCGGMYFKEFETFGLKQYLGFCLGVVLILWGVYLLAPSDQAITPIPPGNYSDLNNATDTDPVLARKDGTDGAGNISPNMDVMLSRNKDNEVGDIELAGNNGKGFTADVFAETAGSDGNGLGLAPDDPILKADIVDPAELEVKKKRAIIKRPTNPADVAIDPV